MTLFEQQIATATLAPAVPTPVTTLTPAGAELRSDGRPYSAHQLLFLMRLASLLRRRREYEPVLVKTDWRMRLLHKSIYSTFCDCAALGMSNEARGLFQEGELAD